MFYDNSSFVTIFVKSFLWHLSTTKSRCWCNIPITSSDIKEYKSTQTSGGIDSLGGAITATEINDNTTHNLWDIVSSAESSAGDTEYRCVYVKNTHGSLTLQSAKVWIQTNTPSTDTAVEIGLGSSAVNGTEQTVANENTAPTSVTFGTANGEGNALSIGNIPSGQHKAVWIKRIVSANAAAYTDDSYVISYSGDTSAWPIYNRKLKKQS